MNSTCHQVVLASNRVLLAISVSNFPVDGTFAFTFTIKIGPILLHEYYVNSIAMKPNYIPQNLNLTSEQQLKNYESFTPQNFLHSRYIASYTV